MHEPQINDIIMRYKTLTETNQDLFEEAQRNNDEIEKSQARLLGLVKEKNDMIMVDNSKLGSKQKLLDKLKQQNLNAEEEVEKKNNAGRERVGGRTDDRCASCRKQSWPSTTCTSGSRSRTKRE